MQYKPETSRKGADREAQNLLGPFVFEKLQFFGQKVGNAIILSGKTIFWRLLKFCRKIK